MIDKVLANHARVIEEGSTKPAGQKFRSYAVSNLRGGVGKSSITFNLAYEISRGHSLLVTDVCPQCNTTELLLGGEKAKVNIYDALRPVILGSAFGGTPADLSYRLSAYNGHFKGRRPAHVIAGSPELFAFPSPLYQQMNLAYALRDVSAMGSLLRGLKTILDNEAAVVKAERILIDTSPFYAGGTHLAWCAVDALIVPVRVDEHSIDSLGLLFQMLTDKRRDFQQWNERAGGLPTPKIAAVVMTMVGAKSQIKSTPDRASTMYIDRALALAAEHPDLFGLDDPSDAFVITDDFHSAGRISGAKRIPISELTVGTFHTVGDKRLQVNDSATRYARELQYLASMI